MTAYGDIEYGDIGGDIEYGAPVGEEPDQVGRTGHPAVDAATRAVAAVEHAAPADQIAAYQAAHRTLREALATIDEQ
jgi:hypothetical protein